MVKAVLEGQNTELSSQVKEYLEGKGLIINWDLAGHKAVHPEVGQCLYLKHTPKGQRVFKTQNNDVVILAPFDNLEISNFNRHFKRQLKLENKLPIKVTYILNHDGDGVEFNGKFLPLNSLSANMRFKVIRIGKVRRAIYRDELRYPEHGYTDRI